MRQPVLKTDFDAPWKIGLEIFFEPFLLFCFPAVHELVDWDEAPVFLDAELQKISAPRRRGKRTADKLVRVRLRDGREEWIYVHVEVQAQRDRDFAARMWTYYYRIADKFGRSVISLAVLADDQAHWKPDTYEVALGGCELRFRFPIFKVIECVQPEEEFARTANPFALLVAAHQVALETRTDAQRRCAERLRLVKYLYRHGLKRETVERLFRTIAWMTALPDDLELQFDRQLAEFQEGAMRINTDIKTIDDLMLPREVRAMEKGYQEGGLKARRAAVVDVLETRFGKVSAKARKKIEALSDEARLRQALRLATKTATLDDFLRDV